MGLHVLAVNGMLIREARSYILRCHGCFKYVIGSVGPGAPLSSTPLSLNLQWASRRGALPSVQVFLPPQISPSDGMFSCTEYFLAPVERALFTCTDFRSGAWLLWQLHAARVSCPWELREHSSRVDTRAPAWSLRAAASPLQSTTGA